MQLVPVRTQEEIELALLAMRIAWRMDELAALRTELAPLEAAFSAFEHTVAAQSSMVTAERNRLRSRCNELEGFTSRIHARLSADPEGVLSSVFSPEEIRRIGDLFGIDIPDDWFGEWCATTSSRDWDWVEFHRSPTKPAQYPASAERAELRLLYRQLARTYHPDLARSDSERMWRQEMMHRINTAWHSHDLATLQSLWRGISPDKVNSYRLVWHRQELSRIDEECRVARNRIAALRSSKTRALWYDSALAQASIARYLQRLRAEIAELRDREEQAHDEFRSALRWLSSSRHR